MKILQKISLALFANIVLILSILLCLTIFNWLDLDVMYELLNNALQNETTSHIILGTCVVLILLAIKCIFFDSSKEEEMGRDGILLENESGKLLVSKDTLENLVNGIVKGFENTENITSRVELDKENNVRVFVNLAVKPNAIIKDLSNNLQKRIKEAVKTSLDLDVKEVNIKIRNVTTKESNVKEESKNEL